MTKILLILITILSSFLMMGQKISGKWNGVLKVQGTQLRVSFNVTPTENGYKATMDSPDQKVTGIPIEKTTFENSILKLELPNAQISYLGTLNKDNVPAKVT